MALGSCSVATNLDGTNFACDDQHACPPDYICVGGGYCARPDWRCGKVNVVADDFEDGWPTWVWLGWSADNGASVTEEGGQAVLQPAAGGSAPSAAYYETVEWYDWADSRLFVEVPQSVNPVAGARAFLTLVFDDDETISIEQEADQLYFKRRSGGTDVTLGSVHYDPVQHRWWQLRSEYGQTHWDTSPDAFDWTSRFDQTQTQPPSLALIRFGAGADADVADPGAARFDNLNGGVTLGHTCRAQDLDEDFEGSGTDGWRRSFAEGGASADRADGAAVVTLVEGDASAAGFISSEAYTLVNNGLSIQVLEVPAPTAGVSTWLRLMARNNEFLGVRLEQDTLSFEEGVGGVVAVMGTVLHDPEAHRYWAISARNGQVIWSTSPDGQSWTSEVTSGEPFPLDTLAVSFGATATAPPGGSTVARFDDVR
jgi:hypothetical protein